MITEHTSSATVMHLYTFLAVMIPNQKKNHLCAGITASFYFEERLVRPQGRLPDLFLQISEPQV